MGPIFLPWPWLIGKKEDGKAEVVQALWEVWELRGSGVSAFPLLYPHTECILASHLAGASTLRLAKSERWSPLVFLSEILSQHQCEFSF